MPLADLLVRQPDRPWLRSDDKSILKPEVAELQRRVESGELSSTDWGQVLLVGRVIHTRPRWPENEPFLIRIEDHEWLRSARIRVRATDPDIGEVTVDNLNRLARFKPPAMTDQQKHLVLRPLPSGTDHLDLEVTIDQRDHSESPGKVEWGEHNLWRGRVSLPVQAESSFEKVLPSSSTRDELLSIQQSLWAWWVAPQKQGEMPELHVEIASDEPDLTALRGLAISLAVELRYHGEKKAEAVLIARRTENPFGRTGVLRGGHQFVGLSPSPAGPTWDSAGWELSFTGSTDGVLGNWEADRWWKGNFSMPLAELKKPTKKW